MTNNTNIQTTNAALVRTCGLSKRYKQGGLFSRKKFVIEALRTVNFEVANGSVTAVVGESGSGKSTLANCLSMLETPDSGEIWFEGSELSHLSSRRLRRLRSRIQMVFQDSSEALNPRFSAAELIAEPLVIQHKELDRKARSYRACQLMEEVGLPAAWADRHPLEFSSGQRQRLAIARALAVRPTFLILDESTSGLDLSTQAQIIDLLLELQAKHSLTYLLISHDLTLVAQIADSVAVMHEGRIVEHSSCAQIFSSPRHPHTRQLLASTRWLHFESRAAHAGECI